MGLVGGSWGKQQVLRIYSLVPKEAKASRGSVLCRASRQLKPFLVPLVPWNKSNKFEGQEKRSLSGRRPLVNFIIMSDFLSYSFIVSFRITGSFGTSVKQEGKAFISSK